MNLLDKKYWKYSLPWGTTVNPNTDNQIAIWPELITFYPDRVEFMVKKELTECWKRGSNWEMVGTTAPWAIGHMISLERYYFGTYLFKFRLPNFRGSWPAIWMIDTFDVTQGGIGIPPELDIFEHFRKDKLNTRFGITQTFHGGPTYENNHATQHSWRRWLPVDWFDINMEMTWTKDFIKLKINGREHWNIPSTQYGFPKGPMNLLIGGGIGTDWNPETPKPFIVKQIEYNG
jgi:hypothetical protein